MANEENLKPFKPGQSGNPKGRPKGSVNITTILKKYLEKKTIKEFQSQPLVGQLVGNKKITNAEAVALQLMFKAIVEGDMKAINSIIDRLEGKPGQFLDITTDGEKITRLTIEVIHSNEIYKPDESEQGTD